MAHSHLPPQVIVAAASASSTELLTQLVERRFNWTVLAGTQDAREAFHLCRVHEAGVLIEDGAFPAEHGVLRQAIEEIGETLVVSLIALPPHRATHRGLCLLKGVPATHLQRAIEQALDGPEGTR